MHMFQVSGNHINYNDIIKALELYYMNSPSKDIVVKKIDGEDNSIISSLQYEKTKLETELHLSEINHSQCLVCLEKATKEFKDLQYQHDLLCKKYQDLRNKSVELLWSHLARSEPSLSSIPSINKELSLENDFCIGKYKLGKVLGQGQYAIVKEAFYNEADRTCTCAVKIIQKDRVLNLAGLKNVSREIEILSKLKSANIVSFKDVIHTEKYLYIMMEKGCGDLFTFFDLYPEGVPEDCARSIISNLLKAVRYIHSQSICHRDLKPEV